MTVRGARGIGREVLVDGALHVAALAHLDELAGLGDIGRHFQCDLKVQNFNVKPESGAVSILYPHRP